MNQKLTQYLIDNKIKPNTMICIIFHLKGLVPPHKVIITQAVRGGWFTYKNYQMKPTKKLNKFVFGFLELAKAEGEL